MLDDYIICPRCQKIQKKKPLKKHQEARCRFCNNLLYKDVAGLYHRVLALSFSGLLFFFIAIFFPLVRIDFVGTKRSISLFEAIFNLLDEGYILIAIFSFLVLFIFPLLLVGAYFLFSLFVMQRKKEAAKEALLLITLLSSWSMLDIFFISILVAMAKIYQYADIAFGVAFWALAAFVMIEIYLSRYNKIAYYWDIWEKI